jgi:cation diffusion facilitator CzcD-associated flavoprotein CzcO
MRQLPKLIDIAIIGAGPQALTLVTHLLQKRPKMRDRLLVFDGSGTWLHRWRQQFTAQEIPHLRSPAVHHPHPAPFALRAFAENRPDELFPPYDLPGTILFEDFCQEVIRRYEVANHVYPASVARIIPLKPHFQLILEGGESLIARRVVLATGGGIPSFPEWVGKISPPYPSDRLLHSFKVDLRALSFQKERVLIVGGGLTSGHLAVGAIARGMTVQLLSRRELKEKLFDAEPGWLGPKYLKGFFAEPDFEKRWQMIRNARDGGSLTPAMMTRLRRESQNGKIGFLERCQVKEAHWTGDRWWIVCDNGDRHEFDRIWLATGSELNVEQHPLLAEILDTFPTRIVKGLPVLDTRLRFRGTEFFLTGGLAALQVGPTARNLSGGIRAGRCIAETLIKPRG